jgi:hypothetical protein
VLLDVLRLDRPGPERDHGHVVPLQLLGAVGRHPVDSGLSDAVSNVELNNHLKVRRNFLHVVINICLFLTDNRTAQVSKYFNVCLAFMCLFIIRRVLTFVCTSA